QHQPPNSRFDQLATLGNGSPVVADELLKVAGSILEPWQIDGARGPQNRSILLRRSARRHGGEGGGVRSPAGTGIILRVCLWRRSAGGRFAEHRQFRQGLQRSRQWTQSQ